MTCVLCGKKSPVEEKIDQFPLSERVRKMLEREFRIEKAGVCPKCLALPPVVRPRPA
jgi:hypothetical protein